MNTTNVQPKTEQSSLLPGPGGQKPLPVAMRIFEENSSLRNCCTVSLGVAGGLTVCLAVTACLTCYVAFVVLVIISNPKLPAGWVPNP